MISAPAAVGSHVADVDTPALLIDLDALDLDETVPLAGQQQVELLGEQLVVVVEVVAEQRERLHERAAPHHDLRAPVREQVDGREVLEDADRVVGAENGDRARQPDAPGLGGNRGEHDRGELGAQIASSARRTYESAAAGFRGRGGPRARGGRGPRCR